MSKRTEMPSIQLVPAPTALDHIDKLTMMAKEDHVLKSYPKAQKEVLKALNTLFLLMVDDEEYQERQNEKVAPLLTART